MKHRFCMTASLFLLLISQHAHAHTEASEGVVEHRKGKKVAAVIVLPYPKEKNESRVFLLAGRPSENIGLRTAEDRHKLEEAKNFLTQLTPPIAAYKLDHKIARQQERVSKAEKRLKALQYHQKKLEEKLSDNKSDQKRQLDEMAKQKAIIETIMAKKSD